MLMSVVSAYYYLRVVVAMYMREPVGEDAWAPIGVGAATALAVRGRDRARASASIPGPLLAWARAAARSLASVV